MQHINFKGSTDFSTGDVRQEVEVISSTPLLVYDAKGQDVYLIASNVYSWKKTCEKDEHYIFKTKGDATIHITDLPSRGEIVSSESMVEIIPVEEMSMYDRLRGEMVGYLSRIAEEKNMDTWEDDNDFAEEDDTSDTPLTPYEYAVMQEEYLAEEVSTDTNTSRESLEEDVEKSTSENASVGSEMEHTSEDTK